MTLCDQMLGVFLALCWETPVLVVKLLSVTCQCLWRSATDLARTDLDVGGEVFGYANLPFFVMPVPSPIIAWKWSIPVKKFAKK